MKLTDAQKGILILSSAKGIGKIKGRKIIESSDISLLCRDIDSCRNKIVSLLGEKDFEAIKKSAEEFDFASEERILTEKNVSLVTIVDEDYPKEMINFDDAPLLLYCKGDLNLLNVPSFAIVGTRNPTKYGERVTEEFAAKLASRFCIVSGMAKGVDGIAQRSALKHGGKTVAVLGCGPDVVYPFENKDLYDEIVEKGLIVSEYAPGTKAETYNFPIRNRIISGLSRAVLVTEAGEKSGTWHTVNHAIKQGKDVFSVPGSIYNKMSIGCNKSIRECQTRSATEVNDIYSELGLPLDEEVKNNIAEKTDPNEEKIINALEKNGEMHFEELLECVELSVPQLNSLLIKMNAVGKIIKTKHNYWSI